MWTSVEHAGATLRIHSRSSAVTSFVPVVFVPGFGASGRSLLPTARALPAERPAFVVDLAGFGQSERPPVRLDLAGHAAVLASWWRAMGLPRAFWVGHSFGSQVAGQLAVQSPEIVERLALLSPTVDPRARTLRAQLGRLLRDAFREPVPLLSILVRDYVRAGPGALLHTARLAVGDRPEERLPAIQAPTLVVCGARDPLVPTPWAGQVQRLLRLGELVVIPRAAHAVTYDAPQQVAAAIEDFLSR